MKYMNTFFKYSSYDTSWCIHLHHSSYTHGHFITHPAVKNISITNIAVVKDGCQSNHLSILLQVKIKSRRAPHKKVRPDKNRRATPTLNIIFDLLKKNQLKHQVFQQQISEAIQNEPNYAALANSIVAAMKEISTEVDTPKPD
jgi:hypothetical protein